ncbi:MAG: glutamate 5-kinase [Actinomycetota bacterium]|nr:glutamate 5-kinase [Actinomycetota bacterium]
MSKKRVVVKVGTAIITEETGRISEKELGRVVSQLALAKKADIDILLVSSGAIAVGLERLGMKSCPSDIETLQAVAAIGQGLLMRMYTDMFDEQGLITGQVLITQQDLSHRQQYLNARHTLSRLLEIGAIPIINENDTVATDEITFGDNDMLAALVSALISADLLIILTDTGGLYTADPKACSDARLIERVDKITDDIEALAGESKGPYATGGMSSKIQAVKTATSSGVDGIIADGRVDGIVSSILEGRKVGTYFPSRGKVSARKHWIGYVRKSCGKMVVDEGAVRAIKEKGGSLLPAGVVRVEGDFRLGDVVDIVSEDGELIAKGVSNYDCSEAQRIMGLRTEEVTRISGDAQEIVHRDGMVVFL